MIVIPLSGYINRLQATASSSIISEELGWKFRVLWEAETVAASDPHNIFSPAFCDDHLISNSQFTDIIGQKATELPRYLSTNPEKRLISLAGHDHGEQAFMRELTNLLRDNQHLYRNLVLKAGGNFHLVDDAISSSVGDSLAREQRALWYQQLKFTDAIESAVRAELNDREPFLGLHLRYGDRSHQAPCNRAIEHALRDISDSTGIRSLFIASDSLAKRDMWLERASKLGLHPWFVEHRIWDRGHTQSASPALIDWRILANSQTMVYFGESSFAYEAAVATGKFDQCISLRANKLVAGSSRMRQYATSLASYPKRHDWFGRRP